MGQRLNIEIVNGETSLANCYYHWSAYTSSALGLTRQIIDAYYDSETFCFDVLFYETIEDYAEYCDESFNEDAFEKLPECPFDLCRIPFDKVDDLIDFVENNDYAREDEMVLCWVA